MFQITPEQTAALRDWFHPERQHFFGLHLINTGNGACFVDRWPAPRTVLVSFGMMWSLSGDPHTLSPDDLRDHLARLAYTSSEFLPVLKTVFPDIHGIDRIVLELPEEPHFTVPSGIHLQRLEAADAHHLRGLQPDLHWISGTWGGLEGLAASGYAWGAFVNNKLASLSCSFFVGDELEDIGVVTEAEYRGRGLAVLCAAALCRDVHQRGRIVSWTTSHDNRASIRVAEKLGFKVHRPDILYVLGKPVPG